MGEQRESGEPRRLHAVRLPENALLPAICPGCLAPGVRPVAVGRIPGGWLHSTRPRRSELTAHYCEICAAAIERSRTARLAVLTGCAIWASAVALSSALAFGSALVPLSIGLTLAAAAIPGGLLAFTRRGPEQLDALYDRGDGVLLARRKEYAESLGDATFSTRSPPTFDWTLSLVPGAIGLSFLGLVHFLGQTSVRVIEPGDEAHALLVDGRFMRRVRPLLRETPGGGDPTTVLGGRRRLTLLAADGRVLADEVVTLWPTIRYLVGQPPSGSCLFVETRQYGDEGRAHSLEPLPWPDSVGGIRATIDQWFAPLPDRPELPTSGGTRRALRLLPCNLPAFSR